MSSFPLALKHVNVTNLQKKEEFSSPWSWVIEFLVRGKIATVFLLSRRAPAFLPKALIRSNMSCQIRRLINQGRDQASPLTDGEMEAGRWWRHFLSSSLTSSSAVNRKQNTRQQETVLPVAKHRACKDPQRHCLPATVPTVLHSCASPQKTLQLWRTQTS